MINIGGVWLDLAQAARYAAPLHLLPMGTMRVPRGPVLAGPWRDDYLIIPDETARPEHRHRPRSIPRLAVIGHDGQRRTTTLTDCRWPSGRDVPLFWVFDLTKPGALHGGFVMLHKALIAKWAHLKYLAGGVPGEHSVPFVCPTCRELHRHGAGATAGGAVLRGADCLSAMAAGCPFSVLLPFGHPDSAAVLTRREAARLGRWQRMPGWRPDWSGEPPGRLTRQAYAAQMQRRAAVGWAA